MLCCRRSLWCLLDTLAHKISVHRSPRWICDRHDERIMRGC